MTVVLVSMRDYSAVSEVNKPTELKRSNEKSGMWNSKPESGFIDIETDEKKN